MTDGKSTTTSIYDDFLEMTRGELEDYLAPRGLSCTGQKRELVARAFSAWERNEPTRISDEELQKKLRSEYDRRLKQQGLVDPKTLPEKAWKKNVSSWPLVDLGKLFQYILDKREFSTDYVGKYKTKKAFSYFKSDFVGPVESTVDPVHNDIVFLRAQVTPSQSVRDSPREVWIAVRNTGQPLTAWCSCTAGFGQTCNHVIAVLYKVEYAIANDLHNPSCTETSCGWNDQSQKSVKPMKIKDMDFRSDSRLKESNETERCSAAAARRGFDPRREGENTVTPTSIGSFLTILSDKSPNSVVFTGLSYQIGDHMSKQLPPPLPDIAAKYALSSVSENESETTTRFFESIAMDFDEIQKIEQATKNQSSSTTWEQQRRGRITASMCHTVHTKVKSILRKPNKKQKVTPLVSEIISGGQSIDHIEAIKWGREHERNAKEELFRMMAPKHDNFSIRQCGLHIHKDLPYIGASPDGIVSCSCCGKSVIEYKCPFKLKGKPVEEAFREVDFLEDSDGRPTLKQTHKYYTQVQCQMAVAKSQRCFFCVWTGKGTMLIEIINYDAAFWEDVEKNLILFYKNYVSRVLLGFRTIYYCPECQKLCLDDGEIEDDKDNVVCCDKCDLWYHWGCVGFSSHVVGQDLEFICSGCKDS